MGCLFTASMRRVISAGSVESSVKGSVKTGERILELLSAKGEMMMLLPPDHLRRVLDPKERLPGTRPEDYGLPLDILGADVHLLVSLGAAAP